MNTIAASESDRQRLFRSRFLGRRFARYLWRRRDRLAPGQLGKKTTVRRAVALYPHRSPVIKPPIPKLVEASKNGDGSEIDASGSPWQGALPFLAAADYGACGKSAGGWR